MADAVDEDLAVWRLHHTTNMGTEATRDQFVLRRTSGTI